MLQNPVEIIIFGAEQVCASCVNLPSAKDTYEWIEAALKRKFKEQPFLISYVDIYQPPMNKEKQEFATRIIEENLFYPVVVIGNKIVGEGNPKLKVIYAEMEKYGYQ
ncbi:YuzD family protein [Cytobacillus sp. Hz8]|uniref:YuzD family protein n=1 Tax=Cytobacillus sp. Hz8 TaxID=3347168 RepID=UPI0035DDED2A